MIEDKKIEINLENKLLSISYIELMKKSICKIRINNKDNTYSTGFFMNIKSHKYLIACYHNIGLDLLNKIINIELLDNNIKIRLNENSIIKCFEELDITVIDINELNIENINFLDYDENFRNGYSQYSNSYIFTLGYPRGDELSISTGKVKKVNDYEFYYNTNSQPGSGGSPIILFNTKKVIGIHKGSDRRNNLKIGTFIGEVVKIFVNKFSKSFACRFYCNSRMFLPA